MNTNDKLRAVLVGCGKMGCRQAQCLAGLPEFELVAVCDVAAASARETAGKLGVRYYTNYEEMLRVETPDTVSVCTANDTHAALTISAAESGVGGVYCEKPMATKMADARAMVHACNRTGTTLVVNHQRRLGEDLRTARTLIESGAIGDVYRVRGQCAGDVLSDGTHVVDSVQWLLGDRTPEWVVGQLYRQPPSAEQKPKKTASVPGYRYGPPVESGAMAVMGYHSNLRFELLCGDMREEHRIYQDYEIFGTKGRVWRTGDRARPNLYVADNRGGTFQTGVDDSWTARPLAVLGAERGEWRAVEPSLNGKDLIGESYRLFAESVRKGTPHPMNGDIALRGFEIVMAVYESARTHSRITLPLEQERFPLEIMLRQGIL